MNKGLSLILIISVFSAEIWAQDATNAVIQNNNQIISSQLSQEFVTSSVPVKDGILFTSLQPSLTSLMLDNNALMQSQTDILVQDETKTCPVSDQSSILIQDDPNKNLPAELKLEGWHVVFEVQFAPTVEKDLTQSPTTSKGFTDSNLSFIDWRLEANNLTVNDIPNTISDMGTWANQYGMDTGLNPNLTSGFVFRKVQAAYTQSHEAGMNSLKSFSDQMSDTDYMNFLSRVASWAPYNDERAMFQQKEGAGLGVVTTKDQMSGTMSGVCGDIHSMVSKMAEVRGWEAITVGYALPGGSQHVVSAIVNPANPDQVTMINYGQMQTNDLNDPNHNPLSLSDDWHDMGIGMRLFKNDLGDGKEGQMVQIGNIPTSMGNFFRDLMVKDYQAQKAFTGDQSFKQNVLTVENVDEKTKEKANGNTVEKKLQNGISVYEGAVDGAHIWGMAVNHDVYKEISKPDGTLKRLGYSGAGLGTAMVDFNRNSESTASLDTLYVYLNMRGGSIYKLVETPYVKLSGLLGYELTGFGAFNRETGALESADGNFETFLQLAGEYNKDKTHIQFAGKLDQTVALRNQNLMTDMNANFLQGNINPFLVNAASAEIHFQQDLGPKTAFTADAKYTVARFGNRISLSTGIIVGGSQFVAGYNGGFTNLRLPGTTTQTNFMTNQGQMMDGLYMGYNGNYNWRTVSGTFNANVGYGLGASNQPFFQVGTKINLGIPPKKKNTKPVFGQ